MALTNADRCSDLAALDRDYLWEIPSGAEFTVVRLTKTRMSDPPRTVCYPAFTGDVDICPISTLHAYISKTASLVESLDHPTPLFITSKKPIRRARPETLGHRIKDTLKQARIDTDTFSAHSTRDFSTSCARSQGVPINEILKVAGVHLKGSTIGQVIILPLADQFYNYLRTSDTLYIPYVCNHA